MSNYNWHSMEEGRDMEVNSKRKHVATRKLSISLPKLKSILLEHGAEGEFLNTVLHKLCKAGGIKTPRSILRKVKHIGPKKVMKSGPNIPKTDKFKIGDEVTLREGASDYTNPFGVRVRL